MNWLKRRNKKKVIHEYKASLAIWGPPRSGKTTLFAMLNAYYDMHGWAIRPAIGETIDYVGDVTDYIFERGQFPPATKVTLPTFHKFALIRQTDNLQQEMLLEMPDAAGEIYADPNHHVFNMVSYLKHCKGIVWLIDPIALTEGRRYGQKKVSYRNMIFKTLNKIFMAQYEEYGRIDKYMAFVLTKMDDPAHVAFFNTPKDYILDLLGRQVQGSIEKFTMLDRVEFFSTSSVGFADTTLSRSNVDNSNPHQPRLLNKDPTPIGIFEPVRWMVESLIADKE